MLTDINLKDENAGLEYCLQADLEKGLLMGWTVVCVNPMPLQAAINTPFLNRQAMVQSPCAQKATAMEAGQQTRVNKVRIGPDGTPVRG